MVYFIELSNASTMKIAVASETESAPLVVEGGHISEHIMSLKTFH